KVNVLAKGIYDGQRMPIVNANMVLSNGYIKSKDFPIPLEKVNLQALAKSDGTLPNSEVDLQRFYMLLDGKPFEAQAFIKNFDDIDFDVKAKGSVDLTKMTKIYPIEGMTLAGIMKADLATKGKMSYVESSQYDKIPTSGMLSLKDFVYETVDMPTVKITTAQLNFDPTAMQLERLEGFAGKSDVQMTGSINNYLGYLLKDEVLQGAFTFSSNKFDVNEWMVEETGAASTEEAPLTVVEVPKDVDFLLASTINEVTYDNLNLKNLKGNILVKEGVITLQKLFFNTLGGEVIADGTYDTRDMAHPKFDIDFGIKKMSIKEASEAFITVNKIAPLAQAMSGEFTTNFKLGGELGQDMMPLFNTLNGSGLINILKGTIKDAPVVKQLSNVTQLSNLNPMGIADVLMQAEVKDGRVYFQPYDVNIAGYKTTVQGSNGLDGSLDYQLNMDLPAGAVGKQLNSSIASLTGQSFSGNENVKLNLGVGGKYTSPKVKLLGAGGKTVKEQVKEVAKDNVVVNKAKEDTQEKAEEILAQARRQAAQVKQTAKQQADAIRREADANEKKMVEEAVKQAGSNPLAKKAAKKAAEKTAAKAKQEAYRKADQLEREADKKAEGIIQKAEQEANRLK
ncbi:MAG: AsmA-like C-terminal region-containing protein, partial [Bacteroidota bacterium]